MNAPLVDSFTGMKEVIAQFIIRQYHNGELYFETPIDINGDMFSQIITELSNKGDIIPIRPNPTSVKELTGTHLLAF